VPLLGALLGLVRGRGWVVELPADAAAGGGGSAGEAAALAARGRLMCE